VHNGRSAAQLTQFRFQSWSKAENGWRKETCQKACKTDRPTVSAFLDHRLKRL